MSVFLLMFIFFWNFKGQINQLIVSTFLDKFCFMPCCYNVLLQVHKLNSYNASKYTKIFNAPCWFLSDHAQLK